MAERTPGNIPEDQRQTRRELRDAVKKLGGRVGLVLERHAAEAIIIEPGIVVIVLRIEGDRVELGINAPGKILILREELLNTDSPQTDPGPASQ